MSVRWNPAFLTYAMANRDPARIAAGQAARRQRLQGEQGRAPSAAGATASVPQADAAQMVLPETGSATHG